MSEAAELPAKLRETVRIFREEGDRMKGAQSKLFQNLAKVLGIELECAADLIEAQAREIERLRAALKPFADEISRMESILGDRHPTLIDPRAVKSVAVSSLYRARKALATKDTPNV